MRIEIPRNKKIRIRKEDKNYFLHIPLRIITRQGEKDYQLESLNVKGVYQKTVFSCSCFSPCSPWDLEEYKYNEQEVVYKLGNISFEEGKKFQLHLEFFFKQLGRVFVGIPYHISGKISKQNDELIVNNVRFSRRRRAISLMNIALILILPILFTFWSGLHTNVFDPQVSLPTITKTLAFLTALATFLGISKDFFVGLNLTKFLDRVFFNIELYYSNDLIKIVRTPFILICLLSLNILSICLGYEHYPINIPKTDDKNLIPYIGEKSLSDFDKIYWKDRNKIQWFCCDEEKITFDTSHISLASKINYGKYPPFPSSGNYETKAKKITLVDFKICQDAVDSQTDFTPKDFIGKKEKCEEVIEALHQNTDDVITSLNNGSIKIKSGRYDNKKVTFNELEEKLQRQYFDHFIEENPNFRDSFDLFKDQFRENGNNNLIIFESNIYMPLFEQKLQDLEQEALQKKDFFKVKNKAKVDYYCSLLHLFRQLIKDSGKKEIKAQDLQPIHALNKSIFEKLNKEQTSLIKNKNQDNLIQELIVFALTTNTPKFENNILNYVQEHLKSASSLQINNTNSEGHKIKLYCLDNVINAINTLGEKTNISNEFLTPLIDTFLGDKQVSKYHSPQYSESYFEVVGELMAIAQKYSPASLNQIDDYIYKYHEFRLSEEKRDYNNTILDSYAKALYIHKIKRINKNGKCIKYMMKNKSVFFRVKKELQYVIDNKN